MAAVASTAGTRRDMITGNWRVVKEDISSVDDTDTWTPGLSMIEYMVFVPSTAGAGTQWGATWSTPSNRQAVVTFKVESGTLAGTVVAYGA